jgi:urease accessory protein
MGTGTIMLTDEAHYQLLSWLSPAFPVGAFAYSHGIEFAVENGDITDAATLRQWLEGIVRYGSGRIDADLFIMAWRAADEEALTQAVEIGQAFRGSSEMALESAMQGAAFSRTAHAVTPDLVNGLPAKVAYAVAVGYAAGQIEAPLKSSLIAFLHAVSANLVSAAVRLIPLGQTDGQIVTAQMQTIVIDAAESAIARDPADIGGAAFRVDWTSMKHETQYTRLFRS